jgi:uncharacterized membrane protein
MAILFHINTATNRLALALYAKCLSQISNKNIQQNDIIIFIKWDITLFMLYIFLFAIWDDFFYVISYASERENENFHVLTNANKSFITKCCNNTLSLSLSLSSMLSIFFYNEL